MELVVDDRGEEEMNMHIKVLLLAIVMHILILFLFVDELHRQSYNLGTMVSFVMLVAVNRFLELYKHPAQKKGGISSPSYNDLINHDQYKVRGK